MDHERHHIDRGPQHGADPRGSEGQNPDIPKQARIGRRQGLYPDFHRKPIKLHRNPPFDNGNKEVLCEKGLWGCG